jgi:hypothetical protein
MKTEETESYETLKTINDPLVRSYSHSINDREKEGSVYYFKVIAKNSNGNSIPSYPLEEIKASDKPSKMHAPTLVYSTSSEI